jgi:hypothetical protein
MLADVKFVYGSPDIAASIEIVLPDGGLFRGRITAVSPTSITVNSPHKTTTTFAIAKDVTITIDGKPSKIADARTGTFAEVTAADGATATNIDIRSHLPGPGGPGGRDGESPGD